MSVHQILLAYCCCGRQAGSAQCCGLRRACFGLNLVTLRSYNAGLGTYQGGSRLYWQCSCKGYRLSVWACLLNQGLCISVTSAKSLFAARGAAAAAQGGPAVALC